MIDIRKLKELVKLMVENDLTELDLQDTDETVNIRRGSSEQTVINQQPAFYNAGAAPAAPVPAAAAPASEPEASPAAAPASDDGLHTIESPMVGTFYSKPNPDAASFAGSGTSVGPDSTVCLIEAMKVFNEIKAETSGVIERVLVSDGDAVEFGQPLFKVLPG